MKLKKLFSVLPLWVVLKELLESHSKDFIKVLFQRVLLTEYIPSLTKAKGK
jgi:hypothetical protein